MEKDTISEIVNDLKAKRDCLSLFHECLKQESDKWNKTIIVMSLLNGMIESTKLQLGLTTDLFKLMPIFLIAQTPRAGKHNHKYVVPQTALKERYPGLPSLIKKRPVFLKTLGLLILVLIVNGASVKQYTKEEAFIKQHIGQGNEIVDNKNRN